MQLSKLVASLFFLPLAASLSHVDKKGVTDAQIETFQRDFKSFDHNADGEVDAFEVRSGFKGNLRTTDLFDFFWDADEDFSGTVSSVEYLSHAIRLATGSLVKRSTTG
uniref:EF-hand domain-containing protein n=1 Tax=Chromera velia CCMP2878 TaxID=1169474 RepID=A0A0G4G018_9ALVE|eukprot:Cvel_19532.t1-p1 / transcript=Cvel_19532.t1 / gene=Cvel_19532 / organism=Chromera_velia_CCMP2878 / gene_product=hypothetical protein / transcript_product=hypothetical protein / location=Cvel_scaffold1691:16830-17812(+) / protein_length=107 / sequence_SO=supercontig / SO=protein_coding / is_pseudo=false